jgi:hypothetical protein
MPELDELLGRFGSGERTWELGGRLTAVLSAAGRTAEIPPMLVQCRPLQFGSIGAERVSSFEDEDLGFVCWRLPEALGRSGVVELGPGRSACDVRTGDRFVVEFGGGMATAVGVCTLGVELVRSTGETLFSVGANVDLQKGDTGPERLRDALWSALEKFAPLAGATLEWE